MACPQCEKTIIVPMTGDKIDFLHQELQALREAGTYIDIRTIESAQGPTLRVNGRGVLNFCSNNYLGLANHPRINQAAIAAIRDYGIAPAGVRTISGTLDLHVALEEKLTRFKGSEAVLVLQSGFLANQAVILALVGKGDLVISDVLNNASIIDGVRLSHAEFALYDHCNMEALSARLEEAGAKGYRRVLVITDGVFGMDGDIAPLPEIVELCERHGAMIMVDDAHGVGVLGRGGRGIADQFRLHGRVDVEVGTLSKAFGVVGGMVAGKAQLIDYLRQRARPFLFSSAMTVPDTAACIAAVELLETSEHLVDDLWTNSGYFKGSINRLGFDTGKSETPITPVMLGGEQLAQEFSRRLFDAGVFAMAITFPTVPKGSARIRVMISATHEHTHLEKGIAAFAQVGKSLGVI